MVGRLAQFYGLQVVRKGGSVLIIDICLVGGKRYGEERMQ